jgi:hypothetical protein
MSIEEQLELAEGLRKGEGAVSRPPLMEDQSESTVLLPVNLAVRHPVPPSGSGWLLPVHKLPPSHASEYFLLFGKNYYQDMRTSYVGKNIYNTMGKDTY